MAWELKQKGYEPGIIGRTAFAAGKGAESVGQLASNISNALFGAPFVPPGHRVATTRIQEALGVEPEALAPQSGIEAFGHRVASQLPVSLASTGLTGGAYGPMAVRNLLGNIPATVATELGAPEWLADLLQLGTEFGAGKLAPTVATKHPKVAKYLGNVPSLAGKQEAAYAAAQEAVPQGITHPAPKLLDAVFEAERNLGKNLEKDVSEKLKYGIQQLFNNFEGGAEFSPVNAIEMKKQVNKLYDKFPQDISEKFFGPIKEGLNELMVDYGKINPQYFENLSEGEKLTSVKNMKSYIGEYGSKIIQKYAKGKYADIAKIFPELFDDTIGRITKFPYALLLNKTAQKHYLDLFTSAYKQNPGLFIKNLESLSDEVARLSPFSKGETSEEPSTQWILKK